MLRGLAEYWHSLSTEWQIALVAIAVPAIWKFFHFVWKKSFQHVYTGKNGRNELQRIYRMAAGKVITDSSPRATVYRIIDSPEFFEQLAMKENVCRRVELDALHAHLVSAWPHRTVDDIAAVADRIYTEILDGLRDAEYPGWNRRAASWIKEIRAEHERLAAEAHSRDDGSKGPETALTHVHRIPGYMRITLTDSATMEKDVKADAQAFFSQPRVSVSEIPRSAFTRVGEDSPQQWREALNTVTQTFTRLKRHNREIHLACIARWLWCYALGVEIQVHHPLVLYHYEIGTYHRIWQINRRIKEQKSPLDEQEYEYRVCGKPRLVREGTNSAAVILGLAIGSHRDIDRAFDAYRNTHLKEVPMWEIRRRDVLDPACPDDWMAAVTDLAYAVDHLTGGGSKELYLFGIMPAVLGLMFGSAVGPYRHVHLLQFDGKSYVEMMELLPRKASASP